MAALIQKLDTYIINPLLLLVYGAALVMFALGVVEFFIGLDRNEPAKKLAGKQHMLYGVIGIFIMATAQGLLAVISSTINSLMH